MQKLQFNELICHMKSLLPYIKKPILSLINKRIALYRDARNIHT